MNTKTHAFAAAVVVIALGRVASAAELGQMEITVANMHCKGCAKKIVARLYTVPGVKSVSVDVRSKTLTVTPQKAKAVSPRQLCEAIETADDRPLRVVGPNLKLLREFSNEAGKSKQESQTQIQIVVEKMHCKACAQKIASKLYAVPGVHSVSVTVKRKTLYVTPTPGRQRRGECRPEAAAARARASAPGGPG